ncbi:hypothetical protein ABE871_18080, partial [Enterococcus gilvus]|uniref:hypothetical protein n=1 Tax=Enterococcus gilvus TaxID=160453 RepID=UPI003D6A4154
MQLQFGASIAYHKQRDLQKITDRRELANIKNRMLVLLTLLTFSLSLLGCFIDTNVKQSGIEFEKSAAIEGFPIKMSNADFLDNEEDYMHVVNKICKDNNVDLINRVIFLGANKNDRRNYFLPINRVTIYSNKSIDTYESYHNANIIFRRSNFQKMTKADAEEGTWYLSGDPKNVKETINEIVDYLNRNQGNQISVKNLKDNHAEYREDSLRDRLKPRVDLSIITDYSALIICCLVVVLCICLEKEIFVYLMHGYSTKATAQKIVLNKLFLLFIIFNVSFCLIATFAPMMYFTREYLIQSIAMLMLFSACTLIFIQILQFRLIRGTSFRSKKERKIYFVGVYLLKVYLLLSLLPALSIFSTLLVESSKYIVQFNRLDDSVKNIGQFYPYYIGNNERESGLGKIDDILTVNEKILKVVPYEDRVLIDTLTYDGNKGWKRAVFIDTNYLKHHNIYDVNHKKIEISANDSKETLIIPNDIKGKERRIKELVDSTIDSDPNVVIASNNISLPTYQTKRSKIKGSDFFICVVPENRLLKVFPNIIGGM